MLKRESFLYGSSCSWFATHLRLHEIPFKWHYHQEYEITLTLNSKGKRYINNHAASYHTYDLVFIAPYQPHSWKSECMNEISDIFVILIPPTWFDRQLLCGIEEYRAISQLLSRASPAIQFSTECARKSEHLFRKITVTDSPLARLSYLMLLFDLLITDKESAYISDQETPLSHQNQRAERIVTFLDTHFVLPLTLDEVARHAHCSVSTVKRDLIAFVGLSFSDYLLKLRLSKACYLLRTTSHTLAAIAMQCGFQDVNYFHRQFNKTIQETPSRYRKKNVI